jgi:hypothetical protein
MRAWLNGTGWKIWLFCLPQALWGQIERVYDETGRLVTVNPISSEGLWEGTGYTFHENGAVALETPFESGKIEGEERAYYEDGSLFSLCPYREGRREGTFTAFFPDGRVQMTQEWLQGRREGPGIVYFFDGSLRIYAWWRGDSLLFAQRFDESGLLIDEIWKGQPVPIDTQQLGTPAFALEEEGQPLRAGQPAYARIFFPKLPSALLSVSSLDGKIVQDRRQAFRFELYPDPAAESFSVYVSVRNPIGGGLILFRRLIFPLE